ncbi:MAG TPA: alcohol dehydrogenase catalytic domain-containing protein, partial [Rubrivivax sp.]|nr:alcohol dehydrogenase catalytic domain-containing protein [Rubrivivax sp.]
MTWHRIVIDEFGPPEVMQLRAAEELPEPQVGEVRVRVLAAGTGSTDTLVRRGQYPGVKGRLPLTPGYDWVGVVDALGPGVDGFAVGDRVADLSVTGGYTQLLCVPATRLVPVPA